MDVTIISDAVDPQEAFDKKVDYYRREPMILNWVEEKAGCNIQSITFACIVLNWRGAMCKMTDSVCTI